jgi:hypothetical protein
MIRAFGRPEEPQLPEDLRAHPAVRNYSLLCLAAVFVLVVCLVDRGLGWWSLLPALIGCIAVLVQWSMGPPLMLLSLTGLILSSTRYRWVYSSRERGSIPTLMDLILCAAVLAYVIGQYRLVSLLRYVFPVDPRGRRTRTSREAASRRSADLVSPWELGRVVLMLPLWTGLTVIALHLLSDDAPSLGIAPEVWRGLLIAWLVLAVLGVVGIVGGYARQNTATPEESLLYLQDQLWRSTRREQGCLNRWLAWARLRWQRRKEKS